VATYESVNTFFVALLDQRFNCDLTGPVRAAQAMGLNQTLNAKNPSNGLSEGQNYIASKSAAFTLGPNGTSPLELSSAYATMANDGKYCPPTPLLRVVGPDGAQIGLPERSCQQRISPGIAHTVNSVLEKDTSKTGGTAVTAFSGLVSAARPIGGKTGTASGFRPGDTKRASGNSSAWFVGYTPDYAGATAVFDPKNTSAALTDVPGKEGQNVFGAYSAQIWRNAMAPFLMQRTWSFPPADPEVINGNSVPVQSVVGLDPAAATGLLRSSGFQVRIAPERKNSAVPAGNVAEQSPSGRAAPGMTITLYLSTGKGAATPAPPGTPNPPGRGGGGGGHGGGG
jgi:membrane peptidoglycan carboxypeptidase